LKGSPHDKPAILLVVDNETKLRDVLPVIRGMIAEGLVIVADAEVIPRL
jgi:PII-like signaling protein